MDTTRQQTLDIAEVARRSGLAASALRYYEQQGLIHSTGRAGARRLFTREVLDRLALIALGRAAGLSLDEIGRMLVDGGAPRIDRGLLSRRADDLDARIKRLSAVRDGLRHAAACRAEDHMACPTFRRLLAIAAARPTSRPAGTAAAPTRPRRRRT